ncbi:class I SAM-dependent methyltransferase [Streptomyces aurantiacus]|uniref:class I SAM-dependent methyltransferase n=1 Tax=Streptomyces aurantiacus TaxID=47760 RepID=UPI0006E45B6F|nr:class I SAM-dependent methyltransferase [Streptomyces aurantiacus]
MDITQRDEAEQTARWNGAAGQAWVDTRAVLDELFKPFEKLLVDAVVTEHAQHVLDVGCGTGATTLAVARRLGAQGSDTQGRSVGVDLSEPMVMDARVRAEQEGSRASFVLADAQEHAFEPATFDMVISRFGVMFFNDSVKAFTNLRRAAREDAALRFIAWRGPAENPFMTTAERAAAPFMPDMPARRPDEPGQFAFADADRVRRVLEESGWAGIDIRPVDVTCALPERELVRYFTRLGPLGLVLREADERTRTHIIETVRAAFDPYTRGAEVRFTAACWTVGARASAT